MLSLFRFISAFAVALALSPIATAQSTYFWNYFGTDPTSAGSWTPGGVPGPADTAVFPVYDGSSIGGPLPNIPSFPGDAAYGAAHLLGMDVGGATFSGNGHTLTLGTGGEMTTAPLTVRGNFGDLTLLNNLTVNIANGTTFASGYAQTVGAVELSGFESSFSLQNGARLRLMNPAGTTNYDLTINGGARLGFDASSQVTNGVGVNTAGQGSIRFHGGGDLSMRGANGVASTLSLNQIVAASGHASVRVLAGLGTGSSARLNVGNGTLQRGIDRNTRDTSGNFLSLGTGTVEFNFNRIPGFGSPDRLFFAPGSTGVPTTNGVIVPNIGSTSNSPYVILTGSISATSGSFRGRFATYNAGTGEVTAQLGTARNESNLSSAAADENVVYGSSTNATLANDISPQTIVFGASFSGQSVNLGGHKLTTHGIIVERPGTDTSAAFTFSLENGVIDDPTFSHQNIFVLGGSNTFFDVSATFAAYETVARAVVKSGGGTMVLTGNTPQMSFGGDIYINQGAVRARIDGAGANLGTFNVLNLRGGVLEVDCNGGTSTFNRGLGRGLNQVNWNFATSTMVSDRGSGGFAAVNGNLNVNIGNGQTLVWNGTSGVSPFFLRSGQYLQLGSLQSNGIVTLQNNLALDDGSANLPYESRTVVTYAQARPAPVEYLDPSRRSVISGVISGSARTSLLKSGPGILELTGANTYAGGTHVDAGVLMVNNAGGSGTGSGSVVVRGRLQGNGTIAPAGGNGVTVMRNASLDAMREWLTPGNLKIGSDGVNNPVRLHGGSTFVTMVSGATFDPDGGNSTYGRLTVRGTGVVAVDFAHLAVLIDPAFTPSSSEVFGILDNQTGNSITGTFVSESGHGINNGGTVNVYFPWGTARVGTFRVSYTGNITDSGISTTGGNDVVLYSYQPVPEPSSVLALSAGAIGLFGLVRRVRRRAGPVA
jgi:autotransporter-associated beta strand protein